VRTGIGGPGAHMTADAMSGTSKGI
jgi:hypothetical protein